MTTVAEYIRAEREARKISQQKLADKFHVSRVTVNEWENGKASPTRLAWIAMDPAVEIEYRELAAKLLGIARNDTTPSVPQTAQ